MATSRPSLVSRARYTSPIPPAPRSERILCEPICRPTSDSPCSSARICAASSPTGVTRKPSAVCACASSASTSRRSASSSSACRRHERGPLALRRGRAQRRRGPRHAAGARGLSPPFSFELAKQPEFRQAPVAFDRVGRHVEHLRRLLHAQATEESQVRRLGSFERRPPPMLLMRDPAPPRPIAGSGEATSPSCSVTRCAPPPRLR